LSDIWAVLLFLIDYCLLRNHQVTLFETR